MYVSFSENAIFESDEEKKDVILDYSVGSHLVGIEVLNESKQVGNLAKVEYEFA